MGPDAVVVLITAKNMAEAEAISRHLLAAKLVACANILSGVRSLFWWQGKVDEADEVLLIAKSRAALFPELLAAVKEKHSYSVPEVLALPVAAGNPDYLRWIEESVK